MPSFTGRQLRFLDKYLADHDLTTQEDLDNAFNESVIKESENIKSSEAEKTRSDLKRLQELFEMFVDMFKGKKEPTPSHEIWTPKVVHTHMFGFFTTMVDNTAPRKGQLRIKAATLLKWYSMFIRLVVENVTEDGKRIGGLFLKDEDRLTKLKDKILEQIVAP
ncbi:hypothetical protein HYPSUDRAFT_792062 [Hypholoma sublateritium FD-334 SS-4]|uniref:Uncharacterized protein n=1 Tax=Hypholoma sublateritium (strain FD-334 SS-4) TaxID=945553 RepID=A0A0D2MVG7_HYPSF|nr:hypothetical protein HYPSUDRAFT_792062 [Hypholoma sublateritium FD-334 SS-4]